MRGTLDNAGVGIAVRLPFAIDLGSPFTPVREGIVREFVHAALDDLVPAARDRGLTPCLENIVSSYYDATAFPAPLERYPAASMTFDTSHALLAGLSYWWL